eukprot:178497-Rhodomonas_salina.1
MPVNIGIAIRVHVYVPGYPGPQVHCTGHSRNSYQPELIIAYPGTRRPWSAGNAGTTTEVKPGLCLSSVTKWRHGPCFGIPSSVPGYSGTRVPVHCTRRSSSTPRGHVAIWEDPARPGKKNADCSWAKL